MAIDKENMSKLLQVLQKKGNTVQGSTDSGEIPASDLKSKMKRRKAKKTKDEKLSKPTNVTGGY